MHIIIYSFTIYSIVVGVKRFEAVFSAHSLLKQKEKGLDANCIQTQFVFSDYFARKIYHIPARISD